MAYAQSRFCTRLTPSGSGDSWAICTPSCRKGASSASARPSQSSTMLCFVPVWTSETTARSSSREDCRTAPAGDGAGGSRSTNV